MNEEELMDGPTLTLEEYLKDQYPSIFLEYKGYINRKEVPKYGDNVVSIRAGFGVGIINELEVTSVSEDEIFLMGTNFRNARYRVDIVEWFKSIARK